MAEPAVKRVYNLNLARSPNPPPRHPASWLLGTPAERLVTASKLPTKVDLRPKLPACYDQGNLGSCTANALCAAVVYDNAAIKGSRLFLYYNERKIENTISQDAGAYLYDGVKALQTYGICPEAEWPYTISKFATKPTQNCYTDALKHKALTVNSIPNTLASMKNMLVAGFPFVIGFAVYSSFESNAVTKTGIVPMPKPNEQLLGGHAVLVCGYDDSRQKFIVRNSWGTAWGDKGYFYMPYAYFTDSNLVSDLWAITRVS
jgi:C1A family cysteine protease